MYCFDSDFLFDEKQYVYNTLIGKKGKCAIRIFLKTTVNFSLPKNLLSSH